MEDEEARIRSEVASQRGSGRGGGQGASPHGGVAGEEAVPVPRVDVAVGRRRRRQIRTVVRPGGRRRRIHTVARPGEKEAPDPYGGGGEAGGGREVTVEATGAVYLDV